MKAYKSDIAKRMLDEGIGGAIFKYLEEARSGVDPKPVVFEGNLYRPVPVPISS